MRAPNSSLLGIVRLIVLVRKQRLMMQRLSPESPQAFHYLSSLVEILKQMNYLGLLIRYDYTGSFHKWDWWLNS